MNDGSNLSNIKYGRNGGRKAPDVVFRRVDVLPQQNSRPIILSNIQQIKDIYLQDTEKVSKEKMESSVLGFTNSADSLQMSPTLGTLVSDETLLNLHPSESIGGLSRRINSVHNLDESSSSTCDISELNATITPVTLMDETEGLILVSQTNMKEEFSVPKPLYKDSSPPKDSKDCVTNVIGSNRMLDKLIQNCKQEPNFTMPLRVSEFGKSPHVGLKPNFTTVKLPEPIYEKVISSANCTSSQMMVDVSRQDLRPIDTLKNSFIIGNPAIMSTTMPNQEQQYCLPMQCGQPTHTVIAQASTRDAFLNANCIVSPSHSRNTMLSIAEHNTKRDNKNCYHVEGINKRSNANEPMLLHTEALFAASPISSSHSDSSQNLSFITDANMLSQINELASQNSKDSRSFRQVDILLSQLQPNDEGVLNLGPLSNSLTTDMCHHGNNSADHALNVSLAIEQNHLAELPPSPLLNTISPDFLDNNSVISKTSPGQHTFLPNLSTTTDLALSFSTHFLENSNMSIDMGSLSEGEGSLNVSHSFVESLDSVNIKKSCSELNFTNALKDAADKYDSVKLKQLAENLDTHAACDSMDSKLNVPTIVRTEPDVSKKRKVSPVKVRTVVEVQRPKEVVPRIEERPVVQQVQCLKCSVCSFLSLEESEMSAHMKSKHSKEEKTASNNCNTNFSPPTEQVKREANSIKVKVTRGKQPVIPKNSFADSNSNSTDLDGSDYENDIKDELYSPQDDDTNGSNSTNEEVVTRHEMPTNKITDDGANYRCGVDGCTFKMKEKINIEYHRKCHSNAFLVCPECSKKFAHWSILSIHLWKEHYIDMELHTCELCDYKSYSYTKLINNHWSTHSSERPFLCDVCGKDFKTAKQLRSHKTVHQEKKEEQMHRCDMCNRMFTEKRMLISHLEAVHNKVKPFLCNFCGKSFASKSTLILHIRKHTGEKPFSCDKCSYRTSDHNSIRRHKMKHSNDKRYSCPYCDYSSIQSSTFKVHLKRKHDIQAQQDGLIFTCKICTFKTVKKDNFLAHIATHHKNSNSQPDKAKLQAKEAQAGEKSNTKKRKRQGRTPSLQTIKKTAKEVEDDEASEGAKSQSQSQQTYYVVQVPQVVNINWDAAETVELPVAADVLNGIILPGRGLSGQIVQLGSLDEFDSTLLQQVEVNNGYLQLTPEVVAVPITSSNATSSSSSVPGIIYVSSETEETTTSSAQ